MGKLLENSFKSKDICPTGKYASVCDMSSIKRLISEDYTLTGKCNYYITNDDMHHTNAGMVFQVLKMMQPI